MAAHRESPPLSSSAFGIRTVTPIRPRHKNLETLKNRSNSRTDQQTTQPQRLGPRAPPRPSRTASVYWEMPTRTGRKPMLLLRLPGLPLIRTEDRVLKI